MIGFETVGPAGRVPGVVAADAAVEAALPGFWRLAERFGRTLRGAVNQPPGAIRRSGGPAYPVVCVSRAGQVCIRPGHPFTNCQRASARQTNARIDSARRWASLCCTARDRKIANCLGNRVGADGERLQFLRQAVMMRNAVHQVLACVATAGWRLRPNRSDPRRTRKPVGKWQKGRESAAAARVYQSNPPSRYVPGQTAIP